MGIMEEWLQATMAWVPRAMVGCAATSLERGFGARAPQREVLFGSLCSGLDSAGKMLGMLTQAMVAVVGDQPMTVEHSFASEAKATAQRWDVPCA